MIKCPVSGCGENLDQREIRASIPAETFQTLAHADMAYYQNCLTDDQAVVSSVVNCPTAGCLGWFPRVTPDPEYFHCLVCNTSFDLTKYNIPSYNTTERPTRKTFLSSQVAYLTF